MSAQARIYTVKNLHHCILYRSIIIIIIIKYDDNDDDNS